MSERTGSTTAILAGGASRRMGADKALLEIEGEPLLARTARIALAAGGRALVVGRGEPPAGWAFPEVPFLPDVSPGLGPMGGLLTALESAGGGSVLAIACDMPLLTVEALCWLRKHSARYPDADVVAVRTGDRLQPLFAVYRPTFLPRIRERLAAGGRRSPAGLIEDPGSRAVFLDAPAEIARSVVGANTPEEWDAALRSQTGRETGIAPHEDTLDV